MALKKDVVDSGKGAGFRVQGIGVSRERHLVRTWRGQQEGSDDRSGWFAWRIEEG